MKYKGLVISDIHVGAMNLAKLHEEYRELFIKKINDMKSIDFVVVCGDFFDKKFFLNDKESVVAYTMLNELVLACKKREIPLRFVYGTESHECDQYNILTLLKMYDNVRVIKYAESEELLPGLKVLYLPEEHLLNKVDYYLNLFLKNEYDYVFGHGIVKDYMTEAAISLENRRSENSKRKEVPVFTYSELNTICKGQIFFGHYHINKELNNKLFSIGSFSRYKFGEEERKGFYELECDLDKNKYKAKFIENTMADSYRTIIYGYDNDIFKDSSVMTDTLQGIDSLIEKDLHNHVRFVFNIPEDADNPEAAMNYIKERYKFNENIKTEIVHGYVEKKKEKQKEKIKQDNEKYAFIEDKSIPIEEKSSRFIEIEYSKVIVPEYVKMYLTKSIQEILELYKEEEK